MAYDTAQCAELLKELQTTLAALDELLLQSLRASGSIANEKSKVYLNEGFGRRVGILKHCLTNIFRQFPPNTSELLTKEELHDVQIALHAFVMNLYGAFENLAWAFVIRHDLMSKFKTANRVGMFSKDLRTCMPEPIATHLTSETFSSWSKLYLKNYRDSLAHRISPYIPFAVFSNQQANRLIELDGLEITNLRSRDWAELEKNQAERDSLGSPSFVFLTSLLDIDGVSPKPIWLHPQLLCDSMTLIEFSLVFFDHWHEVRT